MLKKSLLVSAIALIAASGAHAAGSAGFGIGGTITPGACAITLSGSGIANYGSLTQQTVQSYGQVGGAYVLGAQNVAVSVTCTAPSRVELSFVDNKSSAVAGIGDGFDSTRYGVTDGTGTSGIGAYNISFSGMQADGVAVGGYLSAPNGTTTWSNTVGSTGLPASYSAPGYTSGFVKTVGTVVPDTMTTLAGNLTFYTFITKSYVDAATNAITLDGSGTVTLVYL
ncbi:DUF1120 domain-containing protein [Burkholderia territorii]|uniref:DUF1120 domain-containing protein n=1 Tax=Burkholderia territorii TaxID=1503055 RepID=UPI0009C0D7EE|nr:DUF1120 domain-containing protein [Burkholderia territorii]